MTFMGINLIKAKKEEAEAMESPSDPHAVLTPMTEIGKKGLSRKKPQIVAQF